MDAILLIFCFCNHSCIYSIQLLRLITVYSKKMISLHYFLLGFFMIPCVKTWSYFYSDNTMTYDMARNYCTKYYTDMVAIQNRAENEYLNSILPFNPTYYWIGIRKIKNEWTWVGTNKVLTEEAKNWGPGEPNNGNRNEDCVEMYVKRDPHPGKWNDESCKKKKVALCYIAACNTLSCSGHGECIETINNYTCKCNEGFFGTDCEHVMTCEPLEVPENGSFDCFSPYGNFSYGASCEFQCEEGYIAHPRNTITCSTTGWTSNVPTCEVAKCTSLNEPVNGHIKCAGPFGHFMYNSSCDFSCDEGFELNGNPEIKCMSNSKWDGLEPHCEVTRCPTISFPKNGSVTCSNLNGDFTYDSSCRFTCHDGFVLMGSEHIWCTANGEWTDHIPVCQAIRCELPVEPIHGVMTCSSSGNNLSENTVCQFGCNEGFSLDGSPSVICIAPGQWNEESPKCQPVVCPALSFDEQGSMECIDEFGAFHYNSRCTFICNEGFFLNGSESISCSSSGSWSSDVPTCQAVFCPVPSIPEQGSMECEDEFMGLQYKSKCTFTCDEGFHLIGSESILCTSSRSWSSDAPICQAVVCPVPSIPEQGSMECDDELKGFQYNSKCTFTCNEGFFLNGPESIRCTSSGSWSSDAPTCQALVCQMPSIPEQGSLECEDEFIGLRDISKCTFSCDEGFHLIGSESILCTSTGSWSSDAPTCQAVICQIPSIPEQGSMECDDEFRGHQYDSKCTFTCNKGFFLNGPESIHCTSSGSWSSDAPTCQAVVCPVPSIPEQGSMKCDDEFTGLQYNSKCTFTCNEGFTLIGSESIQCTSFGHWSSDAPICEALECEVLLIPDTGKMNCTHPLGKFKYGSVCEFDCGKGLLNGSSILECDHTGRWSASLPTCEAHTEADKYVKVTIGVAAAASVLSTASLLIWLLKRFRKTAKKFTPSSSCQSLEEAGIYQNTDEYGHGMHDMVDKQP
uniref:E-selectin n=1 Tax=Leptobrachium leishanense TaxID=445787 RepID=A0A8C5QR88_9ANUR